MMIFGFLLLDVLFWGVLPLILLLLLWGDKKFWAATLTVAAVAAFAFMDWSGFKANITDPVWIGNVIKNVVIYVGAGLGFSFLKWKVLASKTARGFEKFLQTWDISIDVEPIKNSIKRRKPDASESEFEEEFVAAKANAMEAQRQRAALNWNDHHTNKYREVLHVVPKEGGGWRTSYKKIALAQYITSWIAYWPFYLVLLVLDDLIRHIADWLVEVFGKGYQKLADASFSDIK